MVIINSVNDDDNDDDDDDVLVMRVSGGIFMNLIIFWKDDVNTINDEAGQCY